MVMGAAKLFGVYCMAMAMNKRSRRCVRFTKEPVVGPPPSPKYGERKKAVPK
jgi:hypothetical protein